VIVAAAVCLCGSADGQDFNIPKSIDEIERGMRDKGIRIVASEDNRFEGDRTQRVLLRLSDGELMKVKWAAFAPGGEAFNNFPRLEIAAYELQKLFLDEADYVVPPTTARSFDLEWYRETFPDADATYKGTSSVLVALQYWLWNVEDFERWDKGRVRTDDEYARRIANLNIFTYLALHSDANKGNLMISIKDSHPRAFAVDNGITFGEKSTDQGDVWKYLMVKRVPSSTVDALRTIDEAKLEAALSVVAQFSLEDGRWVEVKPTAPIGQVKGVRMKDGVLQLGLTSWEIKGVLSRVKKVLKRVDSGRLKTF
jgi:hypothetical protein